MLFNKWLPEAKTKIRVAAAPCPELYIDIDRVLSGWTPDRLTKKKTETETVANALHRHMAAEIYTLTQITTVMLSSAGNNEVNRDAANAVITVLSELASQIQDIVFESEEI